MEELTGDYRKLYIEELLDFCTSQI